MTKFYSLLMIILMLVSCKSDSLIDLENQQNQETNFNFGNSAQRNFHGLVLSTNGTPISGATVSIGSTTVQTNSKGIFVIKNADVKENFAYVKTTKAGFVNGSRTMVPTNGSNRINIMMIPATTTSAIASGTTATVSLPNGTKVKFDGSFKDANGNVYNGNVNVAMFHLKPSDQYLNELMPGSLLANNTAGNARILETFGMLHVQLSGAAGQNLQIANNHTAEMTVAIDAAQASTAPATIPLWAFNETTGIWQEEGSATKVGNTYVGNVSHFSWWNCDAQFPQCVLNVHIQNSTAQPLSNVNVKIFRQNQSFGSAITDANGFASGIVPAGETLILKVYDNCGNTVYTSNVGPFVAGSTATLPNIILQSSAVPTFTIQGTLKTCSGANVTNGLVSLNFAGSSNYFQNSATLVTNGTFSLNTIGCGSSQQFVLEGTDLANLQASGNINFTGTSPVTNLGNIPVCSTVSEFVVYQIDNQSVKQLTDGFLASLNGPSLNVMYSNQSPVGPVSYFHLSTSGINTVGSYTSGFTININQNVGIPAAGNNLTLLISQFGTIGNYIDFTINGTYTDTQVSPNVSRTLSMTGHVKRDN